VFCLIILPIGRTKYISLSYLVIWPLAAKETLDMSSSKQEYQREQGKPELVRLQGEGLPLNQSCKNSSIFKAKFKNFEAKQYCLYLIQR